MADAPSFRSVNSEILNQYTICAPVRMITE